jgi:dCTP deaminase
MLLNDAEIRRSIESDAGINVTPAINEYQIQPASLDVRLGEEAYSPELGVYRDGDTLLIEPGEFVLGTTLEHIELPDNVAAQLTGRSSIGRQGIVVHATAGWIDPGFRGQITLEIFNMSHETVALERGNRVAQLVFFQLISPADEPYDGQYQDQDGVEQ